MKPKNRSGLPHQECLADDRVRHRQAGPTGPTRLTSRLPQRGSPADNRSREMRHLASRAATVPQLFVRCMDKYEVTIASNQRFFAFISRSEALSGNRLNSVPDARSVRDTALNRQNRKLLTRPRHSNCNRSVSSLTAVIGISSVSIERLELMKTGASRDSCPGVGKRPWLPFTGEASSPMMSM